MKVAEGLNTGDSSSQWTAAGKHFFVHLVGDFSTNVVTLQCSPDNGAAWYDYRARDASGSPATVSWSATEVTAADEMYVEMVLAHGFLYRLLVSGSGSSDIDAWVVGDHVRAVAA